MQSKIRKALLAIAGAAMAIMGMSMAGGGVTVAGAETVRSGNLALTIDGRLTPSRLPARGMAPATLHVRGNINEVRGEHPQPLQMMVIDFDRAGTLFMGGLPVCRPAQIENTRPDQARRVCGRAMVGQGVANAQVQFPDQDPFQAPAEDMMIFNGPGSSLVVHAYAFTPLPTTFVVPVRITNSPNRRLFKIRSIIRMPEIAGGHGSLTMFRARLGRTWNWRGKRRSFIYAGCPRRAHRAQGMFRFQGGPVINASVVRRCIPRR